MLLLNGASGVAVGMACELQPHNLREVAEAAIAVINRLGEALEEIFQRSPQPTIWRDENGNVRVLAERSDVQGLTDAAFDAIRQAGRDIPAVLIRMADVLGQLAPSLRSRAMHDAVERQLGKLAETAEQADLLPSDRKATLIRIEQADGFTLAALSQGLPHPTQQEAA